MKCPSCGNEVDTSVCAACPNCRTPMYAYNYPPEIGMRDSFGNAITVGGNLNQPKPKKKINRKVVISLIITILIINIVSTIIFFSVKANTPRTYEEKIILAREDAREVVNQQLRYENLNTWYANNYIDDDGNSKFIIYCDVYGALSTGGYGRIQMYVGIELKDKSSAYMYWSTGNIYPNGDSTPNEDESAYVYVQQLKAKMGWE